MCSVCRNKTRAGRVGVYLKAIATCVINFSINVINFAIYVINFAIYVINFAILLDNHCMAVEWGWRVGIYSCCCVAEIAIVVVRRPCVVF